MFKKTFVFLIAVVWISIIITGCSASKPEERRGEVTQEKPAIENVAVQKKDTVQPVPVKAPDAPVKVETVEPVKQDQTQAINNVSYTVQLGAFKEISNVEKFEKIIKSKFTYPIKTEPDTKSNTYKVTVGKFDTKEEAYKLRDYCVQQGYKDAWVTEYK
jgi:cell division septation protein DedD